MRTRQGTPRKVREATRPTVTPAVSDTQAFKTSARPVLVATDGSSAAGAAITFAQAMAHKGLWAPEAMTAFEPLPVSAGEFALPIQPPIAEPEITQGVLGLVRRQLIQLGAASWNLHVEFGGAATSIVSLARKHNVQTIVLGLGKHGKLARLLGAETASRVCRRTDTPVLAVDEDVRGLPRAVVVAMDFGDSSVRAAREALKLLEPPARLHLLHVVWALNGRTPHEPAWDRTYADGVEHGFNRLREELKPSEGIAITSELRRGGVIESILQVAKELDADIIAAGSHSQNIVDRLLLGTTPAQLLRAAECSVLIAPPAPDTGDRA